MLLKLYGIFLQLYFLIVVRFFTQDRFIMHRAKGNILSFIYFKYIYIYTQLFSIQY